MHVKNVRGSLVAFGLDNPKATTSSAHTTYYYSYSYYYYYIQPAQDQTQIEITYDGAWDRTRVAGIQCQHATEWATKRPKEYV